MLARDYHEKRRDGQEDGRRETVLAKVHREKGVVGNGGEEERDEGDEEVGLAAVRRAPAVAEELASRPQPKPPLHPAQDVGRVLRNRVGGERSLDELAHGLALA